MKKMVLSLLSLTMLFMSPTLGAMEESDYEKAEREESLAITKAWDESAQNAKFIVGSISNHSGQEILYLAGMTGSLQQAPKKPFTLYEPIFITPNQYYPHNHAVQDALIITKIGQFTVSLDRNNITILHRIDTRTNKTISKKNVDQLPVSEFSKQYNKPYVHMYVDEQGMVKLEKSIRR